MKRFLVLASAIYLIFILGSCTTTTTYGIMPNTVARYLNRNGYDFGKYYVSSLSHMRSFNYHERGYMVYEDLEKVWKAYTETEPRIAFDGRIIDFGLLYDPEASTVYTSEDVSPFFAKGQIYILNLKVLGFYNFPIAFQVSKIDSRSKMFEFIYMQKNIVNGVQRVYFYSFFDEYGHPVTKIRHISFFKSSSGFLDKILYPQFHQQTIDDFHKSIFRVNHLIWSAE